MYGSLDAQIRHYRRLRDMTQGEPRIVKPLPSGMDMIDFLLAQQKAPSVKGEGS